MTSTTPLLPTLETFLRLTNSREQAISANMANVDTPGYRTRDIDFQGELKRAMNGVLSDSEYSSETAQMNPVVQEVKGLMERPDGNNVNIDREGMLMAETQLQYQIGVQLVKHQFHQILSAISGGGQS
jgi:flagellar basal-body rod protein FlgB